MDGLLLIIVAVAVCASVVRSASGGHSRGRLKADRDAMRREMADLADHYETRMLELEALYASRISDLEERVDFAERLLARSYPRPRISEEPSSTPT